MTQTDHPQPPYLSFHNIQYSSFDVNPDILFDFSPDFNNTNAFDISQISDIQTVLSDILVDFPGHVIDLDVVDDFSLDLEEFENILGDHEIDHNECTSYYQKQRLVTHVEDQQNDKSMIVPVIQPSLILPDDEMVSDNLLALTHLVRAYGEAIDKKQPELAEVIIQCIIEKVCPIGETLERLLYYLFQPSDKNSSYLKQESAKNFLMAFKAFSLLIPHGRFAFFAANRAILEAMSCDVEVVHIVDFDTGEGMQWSSLVEDIRCKGREIRLTCIKWPENSESMTWRFEETKRRLIEHAQFSGIKLDMEEVELHDLAREMRRESGGENVGKNRKKLVFNCMVGIMGRVRSLRNVLEFLKVAKETLSNTQNGNGGILTFGNGDFWEILKKCSSFSIFLDGYVLHYQALLESIKCTFPRHLGDARTAIECLFVSPFVSSLVWFKKWDERKMLCDFWSSFGLTNWRVSKESLLEAKDVVGEREGYYCPYAVTAENENNNEMVLKWEGVELVRVSFWRS